MDTSHRDLGSGPVMRWSTAENAERIANLHMMVHRNAAEDHPNIAAMRVIRHLMHGDHLFIGPRAFAVIEDTRREGNPVVACTCLWKHTWTYEGIPLSSSRHSSPLDCRLCSDGDEEFGLTEQREHHIY